jgi:hypothetical protein
VTAPAHAGGGTGSGRSLAGVVCASLRAGVDRRGRRDQRLARSELRFPIGASDDTAAYVERLRFTYGEGPCLLSSSTGAPLPAAADDIEQPWPDCTATAVTGSGPSSACRLWDGSTRISALDRYLASPLGMNPDGVIDALAVAERISALVVSRLYTAAAQHADPFSPVGGPLDPLTGRISRGGRPSA